MGKHCHMMITVILSDIHRGFTGVIVNEKYIQSSTVSVLATLYCSKSVSILRKCTFVGDLCSTNLHRTLFIGRGAHCKTSRYLKFDQIKTAKVPWSESSVSFTRWLALLSTSETVAYS